MTFATRLQRSLTRGDRFRGHCTFGLLTVYGRDELPLQCHGNFFRNTLLEKTLSVLSPLHSTSRLFKGSVSPAIDTGVSISTDVTLSGGPNDVWIFQVAGTLDQASAMQVTLARGALPKNIFWQVAGAVTIGTTAHFEGVILAKTMIAANTGATVNGRLLAQTAVTLQMNAVTQPAP